MSTIWKIWKKCHLFFAQYDADVMAMGQLLYFPHAEDQHLYYYDLMARKWAKVARIKGPASIGTIKLTGLAFVSLEQA